MDYKEALTYLIPVAGVALLAHLARRRPEMAMGTAFEQATSPPSASAGERQAKPRTYLAVEGLDVAEFIPDFSIPTSETPLPAAIREAQSALNHFRTAFRREPNGGAWASAYLPDVPFARLAVDGIAGRRTEDAIIAAQRVIDAVQDRGSVLWLAPRVAHWANAPSTVAQWRDTAVVIGSIANHMLASREARARAWAELAPRLTPSGDFMQGAGVAVWGGPYAATRASGLPPYGFVGRMGSTAPYRRRRRRRR